MGFPAPISQDPHTDPHIWPAQVRQLDPIEIRRQVWWILRTSEEGIAGISKSPKVSMSLDLAPFRMWYYVPIVPILLFGTSRTLKRGPQCSWSTCSSWLNSERSFKTSSNILSNKKKKGEKTSFKIQYHDSTSTTEMRKLVEISKKTWKKGTGLLISSVWGKVTKWWEFSFSSFPLWFGGKLQHSLFALLPQRRSEVLLHGWTFTRLIASNAPCHMTTFPQLSPPSSSTKAWYIVRAPCGTNLNTAICLRAFSISFFHGIVLKTLIGKYKYDGIFLKSSNPP